MITPLASRSLQALSLVAACIALPCHAEAGWLEDANGCKVGASRATGPQAVAWSGACAQGLAEGRGQLRRFVNGALVSTYEGAMKGGRESGPGVLTTPAGMRYEGGFEDGVYAGEGRLTDGKGGSRQGRFAAGVLEGACVIDWGNGLRFDGQCQAGSPDGPGEMRFKNGDVYRGAVKFGVLHGQGRYSWVRGDVYDGGFSAGVVRGGGDYLFADGSRYTGSWAGGSPSGRGRLVLADGRGYEGEFERGTPTGAGRFFGPGDEARPDTPDLRTALSLAYERPQMAFIFQTQVQRPVRLTAAQVCQRMSAPQVPPVNWQGEAVYQAQVEVQEGRVVSMAVTAPTPASNPTAHTRLVESIERAIRETYVCPGNHRFEQQFVFRYTP